MDEVFDKNCLFTTLEFGPFIQISMHSETIPHKYTTILTQRTVDHFYNLRMIESDQSVSELSDFKNATQLILTKKAAYNFIIQIICDLGEKGYLQIEISSFLFPGKKMTDYIGRYIHQRRGNNIYDDIDLILKCHKFNIITIFANIKRTLNIIHGYEMAKIIEV